MGWLLLVECSLIGPVLYFILLTVYRLTFHPLAKYPGPWLAKVTSWYASYHAYIGDLHRDMWECHEKYGLCVRYGPDKLLVNSAEALKDVYGHGKNVQKGPAYTVFMAARGAWSTHNVVNKTLHGRKRRILGYGFSDSALKAAEHHIIEQVRILCEQLGNGASEKAGGWTEAKNMADWASYLGFDIMAAMVFNKAFHMLSSPDNRFIVETFQKSSVRTGVFFQSPSLASFPETPFGLDKIFLRSIVKGRMEFMKIAKGMASERLKADNKGSKDIMSHVIGARDPENGTGYTDGEVFGESALLIAAGADTSAVTLAATFFYLVHNASAHDRAASEVRSTFSSLEDIHSGPALNACKYLHACIEETLRMTPPVGGAMWRETIQGGAKIDQEYLPEGIEVGVGMYALHHHPAYFPDAFVYRPERWIVSETATKEQVDKAKSAFHPFSIGPRGCLGQSMAYAELTIALASVLWLFDFKLADKISYTDFAPKIKYRENEYRTFDHFGQRKDGPMVRFRAREMGEK